MYTLYKDCFWQKNDVIKLSHAEIKWSYSVVGSNSQNKVFVSEKFLFFLQRNFPHQAALPSLEATRHLFKKHCNKVGSFTRLSLSLECSYMKYLFAFYSFVFWLDNDVLSAWILQASASVQPADWSHTGRRSVEYHFISFFFLSTLCSGFKSSLSTHNSLTKYLLVFWDDFHQFNTAVLEVSSRREMASLY